MTTPQIRQQERIVNAELARILRERCGLNAQAEVIIEGRQPDVLIVREDGVPVIIETEFMPARSVNDDALAKLGLPVNGQVTGVTFALKLRGDLRDVSQDQLLERVAQSTFTWREWYSDATSGSVVSGSYRDLCNQINRAEPKTDLVADAVNELERGAKDAGAILYFNEANLERVAAVFDREPSLEVADMAALMVINAMVFHDRLSSASISIPLLPKVIPEQRNLVSELIDAWTRILEIDYWPVFRTAYDVLAALPYEDGHGFAEHCLRGARNVLAKRVIGRHDLAGQIFNRLVADRKFLAANYTTIPMATMLAGLALDKNQWEDVDWGDVDSLRDLVVLDPACGTGTLLMAAYREIASNYRSAVTSTKYSETQNALHQTLIEDSIQGADVVDAAIHITASTLASMVPHTTFERMNLHVLPLDNDEIDGARVGSLEWLGSNQIRTMFSGAGEQVGALEGITSTTLERPKPKLLIANPPYRRHESSTGAGQANTRVFGHKDVATERTLSKRLSKLMEEIPGNQIAGLGSSFVCLADSLLQPEGRLAFVLPLTSISGSSWSGIRQLLNDKYEIEYIVSVHGDQDISMSFDTHIREILIVAKKSAKQQTTAERGRFVNLTRYPNSENEGLALIGALRRSPRRVHRTDGPPVGGSPVMLGSDQWGEIVDFPSRTPRWGGAYWKNAAVGQFAFSLASGKIWSADGTSEVAEVAIEVLGEVASISPHHRQIRGGSGVFTIIEGWDIGTQYPAIWHQSSRTHRSITDRPNARLTPKVGVEFRDVWEHANRLHITPDIRYTSQRVHGMFTEDRALGVRSWHTLSIDAEVDATFDIMQQSLALWLNSSLGLLIHANHSNRSQLGRGLGDRTMLLSMPVLDIRQLADWQLDAAETVFRDFRDVQFEPFYRCNVDEHRIELDERLVREVLGLPSEAVDAVARIRSLLAREPSIYGNKQPATSPD
jgi:hypothetical protein